MKNLTRHGIECLLVEEGVKSIVQPEVDREQRGELTGLGYQIQALAQRWDADPHSVLEFFQETSPCAKRILKKEGH